VNASILLWTASLLPGGGPVETQPQIIYSRPVAEKPTVLAKMRSRLNQLFSKQAPTGHTCDKCQSVQYVYPAGKPAIVTSEPPTAGAIRPVANREFVPSSYRMQPNQQMQMPAEGEEVMSETLAEGQQHVYQVKQQFQRKVGRADDCAWITGQLFYVHADGGRWILRYAAIDEEDKYGGSVVLASAVNLKNFREGDLVSVTGHLLNESRASKYLGGPLYRVETIDMIERAD
jgi:hypothetical protein